MAPLLALAQKQPVADNGAQNADRSRGPPIAVGIFHQHAVDRSRRVEQQAFPAKEGLNENIFAICGLRPDLQRVGADRLQELVPGEIAVWYRRPRRNERRRLKWLMQVHVTSAWLGLRRRPRCAILSEKGIAPRRQYQSRFFTTVALSGGSA